MAFERPDLFWLNRAWLYFVIWTLPTVVLAVGINMSSHNLLLYIMSIGYDETKEMEQWRY